MALLTMPRTRHGKHAAKTPFWRQIGIGRARHDLTAQPLVSPPAAEPTPPAEDTPRLVPVSAEQAQDVVGRLFPAEADGLYRLDWQYSQGRATAQVAPALVVDAACNIVLAYAAALDAPFVQEETDEGRLHLRVSRAVDGVQVTVWADITPSPQLALPAGPVVEPEQERLPCERLARAVVDDTAVFDPITDDMDDPREHPGSAPDGDPVEDPTGPDHVAAPDPAATADEPTEAHAADDTSAADDGEPDDADTEEDDDSGEDSGQEAAA